VVSDRWSVAAYARLVVAAFAFAGVSSAQNVGNWPCPEENLQPNLTLKKNVHVCGVLKDPTGAAFETSKVLLGKQTQKGKFVEYRSALSDKDGHFDLKIVEPGKYRLLPGPNRGWKQPKGINCGELSDCEIKLVLEPNPTDMPFAQCPVQ